MKFNELNLSEPMQETLAKMGFDEATPIQAQAIPPALEGRDIIGQAQTGTGKTAGFSVPIIEQMEANKTMQTLILVPTRELALQVAEAFKQMASHTKIRVATVFGGAPISQQIRNLKQGYEVVVGTPGRTIDLLNRKVLKLDALKFLVLDEVDEMLSMGFIEDIELIASKITSPHQTLFFSATMTPKIQNISKKFLNDPVYIKIKASKENLKKIDQSYLVMRDGQKQQVLSGLLRTQQPERAIIFAKTKKRVDEVTDYLVSQGFVVDRIHGDLSQEQRTFTFKKFRNGLTPIVVATDVAARGLDIKELSHVYNYDLPQENEYYVHRIGRTGRADASGEAISFMTPKEVRSTLPLLEKATGSSMTKKAHPTAKEVVAAVEKEAAQKLVENIDNIKDEKYFNQAKKLLEEHDATSLLASALMELAPDFDEAAFVRNFQEDNFEGYRDREERRGNRGGNRSGGDRRRNGGNRNGGGGRGGNRNGGGDRRRNDRKGGRRNDESRYRDDRRRNDRRNSDTEHGSERKDNRKRRTDRRTTNK